MWHNIKRAFVRYWYIVAWFWNVMSKYVSISSKLHYNTSGSTQFSLSSSWKNLRSRVRDKFLIISIFHFLHSISQWLHLSTMTVVVTYWQWSLMFRNDHRSCIIVIFSNLQTDLQRGCLINIRVFWDVRQCDLLDVCHSLEISAV